jgi:16S rRNA (guanine527-N7)-methyltransferase
VPPDAWEPRIREFAASLGHPLSPERAAKLVAHWHLVEAYGRTVNLTALRGEAALVRHILDSLTVLVAYDGTGEAVDLGSGAGYPGLALAVVFPEAGWTLVEATAKKARFLETARVALGLERVEVVTARAEEWDAGRGRFAWATARGVGALPLTLELAVPLLRERGRFLAMRGPGGMAEAQHAAAALAALRAVVERVWPLTLPDGSRRTVIVIRKTGETPGKFPRRGGALGKF